MDYIRLLQSQANRLLARLLYPGQITDFGVRHLWSIPRIRFKNGTIVFGKGCTIRGRADVVFGDPTTPGALRLGENFVADGDVTLSPRGGSIVFGQRCFVGKNCLIQAYRGSAISIGDDVMIAHGVTIVASNHSIQTEPRMNLQPEIGTGITIGKDCWIAADAILLDGITVGDGAVIAAGAVVRTDVEPFAIYAGVPAKKVGQR